MDSVSFSVSLSIIAQARFKCFFVKIQRSFTTEVSEGGFSMDESVRRRVPTAFIWRRVHSLLGLWLVLFLAEHLLVNSQAALWIGDEGHNFVRFVNFLESLPFLYVLEVILIGVPLLVHGGWGIKRALTSKANSRSSDGSRPSLGEYGRNRAYTWQRITSWILLFGILYHVVEMRFLHFPKKVFLNNQEQYLVKLTPDDGLYSLSQKLGVSLYSPHEIETHFDLKENQVAAAAATPGQAMLLSVRDTFKSPLMAILYTIFVLSAAFHAFNGFWTFLITWGVILAMPAQKTMTKVSLIGILILSFLGLAAIWGSYWI